MYDLIVIGAGSGGVRAARVSSQLGAKVAVVESRFYGGTCVNVGCVPKKLFVYASHYGEDFHDAAGFGWTPGNAQFDWPTLVQNKNREIERLNGVYKSILSNAGVEMINGHAEFIGPNQLQVEGRVLEAKKILIATGSRSFVPDIPGRDLAVTSDDMFYLKALPKKAIVVGGGYIAVEFAGILAGLGVDTQLVYRGVKPLKRFDADVQKFLTEQIVEKGVKMHLEQDIQSMCKDESLKDGQIEVLLNSDKTLQTDLVLYATGRKPNADHLNLEKSGVEIGERGEVMVDEHYRTSNKDVFAVGDVIDRMQLTPVALAEGMYVAHHLFGNGGTELDYKTIPTAVFSQPNFATVGLTEEQARQEYADVAIYLSDFKALKHTLTENSERTMMKLIVDKSSDRVVGVHMVGSDAAEIIQGIAIAVRAGATKAVFDSTIGIHPSSAEEFVTMREPVRS